MGYTLIACLLMLMVRADVSAEVNTDISCPKLCKSLLIQRLKAWPANCDCSSIDDSFPLTKQLDDNGIYYEPSDIYTLQRLSFKIPPFVILNPILKLNIDSSFPKVIKKRKLSHHSKYTSSTTDKVNKQANKRPLYLDIDVQEPIFVNRSTLMELKDENQVKLSENDFKECVNLFMIVYSMKNNTTTEPKIIEDIKEKCIQPADVVRQSLQEIKNIGLPKISSFRNTQSTSSKERNQTITGIELPTYNKTRAIKENTIYPKKYVFQHLQGDLDKKSTIPSDNFKNNLKHAREDLLSDLMQVTMKKELSNISISTLQGLKSTPFTNYISDFNETSSTTRAYIKNDSNYKIENETSGYYSTDVRAGDHHSSEIYYDSNGTIATTINTSHQIEDYVEENQIKNKSYTGSFEINFIEDMMKKKLSNFSFTKLPDLEINPSTNYTSYATSRTNHQHIQKYSNITIDNETSERSSSELIGDHFRDVNALENSNYSTENIITTTIDARHQIEDYVEPNQKDKNALFQKEVSELSGQSDINESFIVSPGSFTNQYFGEYSTEPNGSGIDKIVIAQYEYDSTTSKLDSYYSGEDIHSKSQVGPTNITYDLTEFPVTTSAASKFFNRLLQNRSISNEENETVIFEKSLENLNSITDSQTSIWSSLLPIDKTVENVGITKSSHSNDNNDNKPQYKLDTLTTQILTTNNSKYVVMPDEENLVNKAMYDTLLRTENSNYKNNLNKSITTRSTEITTNHFEDYYISTSNDYLSNSEVISPWPHHTSNLVLPHNLKSSSTQNEFLTVNDGKHQSNLNNFIKDVSDMEMIKNVERQTTHPYKTKEELTTTTVDSYMGNTTKQNIGHADENLFAIGEHNKTDHFTTDGWYKTQLVPKDYFNSNSGLISLMTERKYIPVGTNKINANKWQVANTTETSVKLKTTNLTKKLTIQEENNKTFVNEIQLPKVVTKEFENDTVVSNINNIEAITSDNFTEDNKSEYVSLIDNTPVHRTSQQAENTSTSASLTGNLYFVFNNTDIPAKFVQNEKGEISVGIDGESLCTKLKTKDKSLLLINMICNCLLYQNCLDTLLR